MRNRRKCLGAVAPELGYKTTTRLPSSGLVGSGLPARALELKVGYICRPHFDFCGYTVNDYRGISCPTCTITYSMQRSSNTRGTTVRSSHITILLLHSLPLLHRSPLPLSYYFITKFLHCRTTSDNSPTTDSQSGLCSSSPVAYPPVCSPPPP